jgi:hypothetical protein
MDERRHFKTLSQGALKCNAKLLHALQYRGLAARQSLKNGDIALQLPHSLALTVPDRHSNIYRWEVERLEPWELAHGALPAALAYYIAGEHAVQNRTEQYIMVLPTPTGHTSPKSWFADADEPAAVRLAAWVLYLRSSCHRQQHGSDFWLCWLDLLPEPHNISSPGCWTRQELQQLQMEPLQVSKVVTLLHSTLPCKTDAVVRRG